MLKDASRRKFDVVMGWAVDRLGRSLIDLPELCRQVTDAGQVAARPREAVHEAGGGSGQVCIELYSLVRQLIGLIEVIGKRATTRRCKVQ